MANKLLQIVDDDAGNFIYSGGEWTLSTLIQWYNQTSNFPGFASSTQFGSFTMEFEGISIAFIGNTPTNTFSQSATVSIDGGKPYSITYSAPPPSYVQWYQSPALPEGKHNITVGHLAGTAVDYAIIELGQNTPLVGKTVVVDNKDAAIRFSGVGWTENDDPFNAGTLPDGFPLHNSTHRTSTPGDMATFKFSGTSASVYGLFSWTNLGLLTITYTIDGNTVPQSYSVTSTSPQHVKQDGDAINFVYFSQDNLPAGDHTLVINITQSENLTFALDFITYTPSFSSLSTMPNLTTGADSTGSQTTATSLSPTSASMSASPTIHQVYTPAEMKWFTGIIGGSIGGVAFLLITIFFLLYLRRRVRNRRSSSRGSHAPATRNSGIRPPAPPLGRPSQRRGIPTAEENVSPFTADQNSFHGASTLASDLKRERMHTSDAIAIESTASPTTSASHQISSQSTSHLQDFLATNPSTDPGYLADESMPDNEPPAYERLSTYLHPQAPRLTS